MIILKNVTKSAKVGGIRTPILAAASLEIPTNRTIAVVGPAIEHNRTLIKILAGATYFESGQIARNAALSFPIGELPGLEPILSVEKNVAHVARLYKANVAQTVEFVRRFMSIGHAFDGEFAALSPQQKKSLAHIIGFALPFDCYLTNDSVFSGTAEALFQARASSSGVIAVAQNAKFVRTNCEMALLLREGRLSLFDDVEEAIAAWKDTALESGTENR